MSDEKLAQALRKAFNLGQTYWQQADSEYSSQWKKSDATRAKFDALVAETIAAHERAQPASVAGLQLTQSEREALNYLGSALKHKPHAEAVDRALVICDHYAKRAQLTICHEKLHERMLAAAPQPAKEDDHA